LGHPVIIAEALARSVPRRYNFVQTRRSLPEENGEVVLIRESRRLAQACVVTIASVAAATSAFAGAQKADKPGQKDDDLKRPKLSLKATPVVAMSPARVVLTAELNGGANDFEEFYCATTEWDWGDGTQSEASMDCEPYEPGKSEIKRRFTVEHVFRAGNFRIQFRLKRRDKTVAAAGVSIQVRPGLNGGPDEGANPLRFY
jgi:hypothetical protein